MGLKQRCDSWIRSSILLLGAVAALLYADEDNMLDAMVLDSPFASLRMHVFVFRRFRVMLLFTQACRGTCPARYSKFINQDP